MTNSIRAFFLSLTIVAVLLFSAFRTTNAYADDGDGAATATETGTGTEDGGVSTPVPDTAARQVPPAATAEAPAAEARLPVEEVVTGAIPAGPILDQVPDNTTVTVIGAEGEAIPLASQASADAIASDTDPIWCPASQTTPTPGANGCTEAFTSFDTLLSFLSANETDSAYQQAGTIYIEQGSYAGGEASIDFNDYNFTSLNQYNLTLQGGWDISDNSLDSTTTFDAPIVIGSVLNPWVGSLSFNGISISGISGQAGLILSTQSDIALSNVSVTDSQAGAELNAGGNVIINNSNFSENEEAGARINAGGKVEVTNAQFNNNGSGAINNPVGYGLNIENSNAVSLASVSANSNQLYGANIKSAGDVIVTNSFFAGNQGYAYVNGWEYDGFGIKVITTNKVTLDGVAANDNYLFGAHLEGAAIDISNSSFNANSTDRDDPVASGLEVISTDTVTLANVHADNNQVFGANIMANSSVVVKDSFFNGNQSYSWSGDKTYFGTGLQITTNADIGLKNVAAEGNYLLGAHLEASDIAVSDGFFSNNGSGSASDLVGRGLEVVGISDPLFGEGDVALFNVVANNNQLFGANIQTVGDVAIGGTSSFSGHLAYVYDYFTHEITERVGGYGLQVTATGNIALQGVTANNNFLYGASLQGFDVAVSNSTFSTNGSALITQPTGYGLNIESQGSVAINHIEANNNQLYGADITAAGNVDISAGVGQMNYFSGNQAVSFTPCLGLTFYGYGLNVYTATGDITMNRVEASFNNLWGASVDGMNIDIINSRFNNNVSDSNIFIDDTGLLVNSRGAFVRLDNVEALENRLIGADITAVGDVFISNSNFSENRGVTCTVDWCPDGSQIYHGYGLKVVTPGSIALSFVTANSNNLFGAHLEGSTVNVADSTFSNNGTGTGNTPEGRGLEIISTGDVSLMSIEASNNQLFGVDVQANGNVTVIGSIFTGNSYYSSSNTTEGYGLKVVAKGDILVSADAGFGSQAGENGAEGAILDGQTVQVVGSSFFDNGSSGLSITSVGDVTLTNVTATGNSGNGVEVIGACTNVVNVNGGNFANNAEYGLNVAKVTLILDGTQTFANNGSGNVFTDTACVVAPTIPTGSTATTNTDGNNSTMSGNIIRTSVYSRIVFADTNMVLIVPSAGSQTTISAATVKISVRYGENGWKRMII